MGPPKAQKQRLVEMPCLRIHQQPARIHEDMVSCVGWSASNELISISDDHTIRRWDMDGQPQEGKVCDLENFSTSMHWFPNIGNRAQGGSNDFFAVGCTDGTFKFITKAGRMERSVDAHQGAVVCVKWNFDGTAIATCGEDGGVKVWSRSGQIRSPLAQNGSCVHALSWSPEGEQLLYTCSKQIVIKPMQPSLKQMQWNAHDGVVLTADWNPVTNLIVSGGEDCRYKVWDAFGRLLFQSSAADQTITSVAWRPDGELFAVGSFEQLSVCDKRGWAYSRDKTQSGSVLNISWTSDGTQLAGAGAKGDVVFGQLVDRRAAWESLEVALDENNHIKVFDVLKQVEEAEFDFPDRVIDISLAFGHLVVATARQCHIYGVYNLHTPQIFELRESINLIIQSEKCFATIDNTVGVRIWSYEGRQNANPKFSGLRPEFLNRQNVSLSNDVMAIIDRNNPKTVRLFDTKTGGDLGDPIQHQLDIMEIALGQAGLGSERKLALLDRNRGLYITPVHRSQLVKLGSMVDTFIWHPTTDMLSAVMDGKLCVWHYPNVVYIDPDLINATKSVRDGSAFGKNPQLVQFAETHLTIRRSDGALMNASVAPFPSLLYEYVRSSEWEAATRLCRFVKDQSLWACLAAMALNGQELATAEVSFAAIDEVDKLQYILYIKDIPSSEGRAAEMALFRRRPEEAEQILLQAQLYYRAIKVNIRLFNWERALELAKRYEVHIDTVCAYRQKYLQSFGKQENSKNFKEYSDIEINWEMIKARINEEKEKERERK